MPFENVSTKCYSFRPQIGVELQIIHSKAYLKLPNAVYVTKSDGLGLAYPSGHCQIKGEHSHPECTSGAGSG